MNAPNTINAPTTHKPYVVTVADGNGVEVRRHRFSTWEGCRRKLLTLRAGALCRDWGWTAKAIRH